MKRSARIGIDVLVVAVVCLCASLLVPVGSTRISSMPTSTSVLPAALPLQEYVNDGANNQTWNAYDDTVFGNGPSGFGDDIGFVDPGDGLIHVFMRAANNDLAEFVNDNKTPNQAWSVYDLTSLSGGAVQVVGPASPVFIPSQGKLHVYVQGGNGDLYDFTDDMQNGRTWNAYDISLVAGRGGPILQPPSAIVLGQYVHVYTESASGDLVEYVNDGAGGYGWNAYDHSADAWSGSAIAGPPAVMAMGGYVHVYVEAASGDLVEYVNDGANGLVWSAYDHSDNPGGDGPITNEPDPVLLGNLVHVYVRVANGDLVEYISDHQNGRVWNAYDQTLASGGATFVGVASGVNLGGTLHVYVHAPNNDLVEYVNDDQNGRVWNAYDQTLAYHGPTIGTDASALIWSGHIHVYAGGPKPPDGPPATGVGVYGFGAYTPTSQAITDGWPVIGDTGGLGTPCPPYAALQGTPSNNPDLQVGQAIVQDRVRVTWLSFWTVSGPAQNQSQCPTANDTWYTAGYQGGQVAAQSIDSDYRYDAMRPDWLILDPEGYNIPPSAAPGQPGVQQDTQNWVQFISGWADGIHSVDTSLHPGFYVNQSEYYDNGLASENLPAFIAVSPICFDQPTGNSACAQPNRPFVSGNNIYGYIAYYGYCSAGAYESAERNWGGVYNTLQFQSGTYCAP